MKQHARKFGRPRGQTLVETLVAITLTSLVLAAGFAALTLSAHAKAADEVRGPAAQVAANVAAELRAAVEYDPNALANLGNASWSVSPPPLPKGAAPSDGAPVTVTTILEPPAIGAASAQVAVGLTFSSGDTHGATTLVLQEYAPPPGGIVYLSATPAPGP